MKSNIYALIVLAVMFVASSVSSSAKGVPSTHQQFRSGILKDGPGPMCFPHSGCGYTLDLRLGSDSRREILLTDGPGPMCFPSTGCGLRADQIEKQISLPRTLLLTSGTELNVFSDLGGKRGQHLVMVE
jgi:hypothetical protein